MILSDFRAMEALVMNRGIAYSFVRCGLLQTLFQYFIGENLTIPFNEGKVAPLHPVDAHELVKTILLNRNVNDTKSFNLTGYCDFMF